jgi:peptidoglycan L-alanyl-D-glutamate endopeptidase CwlK
MAAFGTASEKQLATCHPDLQRLFRRVVEFWDCQVLEGKRTEAQQRINLANGVSKTFNSKHVFPPNGPSLAADVAPFPVKWNDLPRFYAFAGFVIGTARELGIKIRWGGDWDSDREFSDQKFNDLPHFELVIDEPTTDVVL